MSDKPDLMFTHHGTLSMLHPVTDEGRVWASDHLPEDAQWLGGACAVEPRYVEHIVEGIEAAGLAVSA